MHIILFANYWCLLYLIQLMVVVFIHMLDSQFASIMGS